MFYRPINQLSKGYRQRTGLAQAILSEPDVLILDEPTEGLDPNQRVEIRNLITHLGEDRTVLLSTHVMQEVQATCSRLLIINNGKLIADDSVDSLLSDGDAVRVVIELDAEPGEVRAAIEAIGLCGVGCSPHGAGARFVVTRAMAHADPRKAMSDLARDRGWTILEIQAGEGMTWSRSVQGSHGAGVMNGRNVSAIANREFRGYFDQATAYILLVAFLVANFFFFFRTVLATGEASLRPMFSSHAVVAAVLRSRHHDEIHCGGPRPRHPGALAGTADS